MKLSLTVALAAAAIGLSGCAQLGMGGTSGADTLAALKDIVTSTSCAHHDEVEGITGAAGVPGSFHAKAVRDCPAAPAPTAAETPAAPN
jgi:hypothetical protein